MVGLRGVAVARVRCRADRGVVFAVGDVADPVESVFDVPVPAWQDGDLGGAGLSGQGGDTDPGVGFLCAGGVVGALAGDAENLCRAGKATSSGAGRTSSGALFGPAVTGVLAGRDLGLGPVQTV